MVSVAAGSRSRITKPVVRLSSQQPEASESAFAADAPLTPARGGFKESKQHFDEQVSCPDKSRSVHGVTASCADGLTSRIRSQQV
jgi:hypothetical protein